MRELPLRLQRDGASSLPLSRAEPWRSRVANGRRPDVRAAVGWGRGSASLPLRTRKTTTPHNLRKVGDVPGAWLASAPLSPSLWT